METVIRTAADIARVFADSRDDNHDAALCRLLKLGARAGNADALCLYWRVRERVLAVDDADELAPDHPLLTHTRRILWPWLKRQRSIDQTQVLLAPPLGGLTSDAPIALLPLCDARPQLAGLVAVQLDTRSRNRLLGPWRPEAVGFAELVQDWLQAELDPETSILSAASFNDELSRFGSLQDQRRRRAVVMTVHLDYLQEVRRDGGEVASLAALREFLALVESRLRGRDLLGRMTRHSVAILLHQCSPADAELVSTTLRSSLSRYRFRWHRQQFVPRIRIEMRAVQVPHAALSYQRRSTDASTGTNTRVRPVAGAGTDDSGRDVVPMVRAQPCVRLDGTERVVCHRLRGYHGSQSLARGTLRTAGDGLAWSPAVRQRYCHVLDVLSESRSDVDSASMLIVDLDVNHTDEATIDWLLTQCQRRGVSPMRLCLSMPAHPLLEGDVTPPDWLERTQRAGFQCGLEASLPSNALEHLRERLGVGWVVLARLGANITRADGAARRRLERGLRSLAGEQVSLIGGGLDTVLQRQRAQQLGVRIGYGRACGPTQSLERALEPEA